MRMPRRRGCSQRPLRRRLPLLLLVTIQHWTRRSASTPRCRTEVSCPLQRGYHLTIRVVLEWAKRVRLRLLNFGILKFRRQIKGVDVEMLRVWLEFLVLVVNAIITSGFRVFNRYICVGIITPRSPAGSGRDRGRCDLLFSNILAVCDIVNILLKYSYYVPRLNSRLLR